jgi:methyltransferase (TIGR00027 family)
VTHGRALADAGLSHIPNFRDPTARAFLPEKRRHNVGKYQRAFREGKRVLGVEAARVMADMIALRTTAIDAVVREAIAGGAQQLVILGAGYDGRAWRMPELAEVKVFEVDHSATQRDKRTRAQEMRPTAASINFVAINFEKESLDTVLARAGHDRSVPTCWIWEGVVMYLTREAMRGTLANIAARSAAGSTLIVNYHTIHRGFFARLIFRLIGEPQISAWAPEQMAADMRTAGFVVRADTGMTEWNTRYASGEAKVDRGYYMRIAVARKE